MLFLRCKCPLLTQSGHRRNLRMNKLKSGGRRPIPPMGGAHINPSLDVGFDPSANNAAAGKRYRTCAVVIDNRQFQIAVEWRSQYVVPHDNPLNPCAGLSSCHLPPKIWHLIPGRRYQRTGVTASKAAKADMSTAQLNAIRLWCRVRCFGLPLYSATAREALAERLGLLLQSATAFWGKGDLCETVKTFEMSVPPCPTLGGTKV